MGQHASERAGRSGEIVIPDVVAPEHRNDYIAGWLAGRRAAATPLPDNVARDVVMILDALDAAAWLRDVV
jgi:hypothetical protein